MGIFDQIAGPSAQSIATYADLHKRWSRIEADLQLGAYDPHKEHGWGMKALPQEKTLCLDLPEIDRLTIAKNIVGQHAAWIAFAHQWESEDNQDVTQLSSQVSNLSQAEKEINSHGGCIEGAAKPAPDIETASSTLQTASSIDKGAKEVNKAAKEAIRETAKTTAELVAEGAKGAGAGAFALPWWVWPVGGAAVLVIGAVALAPELLLVGSAAMASRRR